MFRTIFAHHQERETDFYSIWCPVVVVGKNCPKHVELIL